MQLNILNVFITASKYIPESAGSLAITQQQQFLTMGHSEMQPSHVEDAELDTATDKPENQSQDMPRTTSGDVAPHSMNFHTWMAFIVRSPTTKLLHR